MPPDVNDAAAVQALLDELAHPPVVLTLVVAHARRFRGCSDGELVTFRTPLAAQRCPLRAKNRQHRIPRLLGRASRPHVRVAVVRTRQQLVRHRAPVYARDELVVLLE